MGGLVVLVGLVIACALLKPFLELFISMCELTKEFQVTYPFTRVLNLFIGLAVGYLVWNYCCPNNMHFLLKISLSSLGGLVGMCIGIPVLIIVVPLVLIAIVLQVIAVFLGLETSVF